MIDLRTPRADPDRLRASQRTRGEDDSVVERLLDLDERWRAALGSFESLRAEQKSFGRSVRTAEGDERRRLLGRAKELARQVKDADAEAQRLDEELTDLLRTVPNIVEEGAPAGGEDDYVVLETVGAPPAFGFAPKDHLELGTALGAIDTERGAKVSGAHLFYLTGVGAQLQLALLNLAMERAIEHGFTAMVPPALVKPEVMERTGFPGAHPAEIALAGYHMNEIIDALPRRYVAWSSCVRRDAGSVEMFSYCDPADAREEHLRLLGWQREMLAKAELPYRVIDTAGAVLGASAARRYDCEVWAPAQGRYRALISAANCTDFQARRMSVRFRADDGRTRPVATLGGTLATTRWIFAILENHQRADGSVRVPKALRRFLGRELLEPVAEQPR